MIRDRKYEKINAHDNQNYEVPLLNIEFWNMEA